MTIKHTPGPWYVDNMSSNDGDILITAKLKGHTTGRLHIANVTGLKGQNNVNLISAAPKLLEAAKAAVPFLVSLGYVGGDIVDGLQSAIAKAEGDYDTI